MQSLVDFLMQRIAEDETAALAAVDGQADPENGWGYEGRTLIPHVGIIHHAVQAEHITRWHPYRVVAECAAKRAIIAEHECLEAGEGFSPDWYSRDACLACETKSWPCRTVSALLAVYADHPDYQTEWKLDTHSEAG